MSTHTLIKNRQIVTDDYTLIRLAEGEDAATLALPPAPRPLLVPLTLWQARREELLARGAPLGVWLESNEGPESLAQDLAALAPLALIAVNFPKFTDGRGYSIARLLRERWGYSGEIRAIGEVLHDQLFLMTRCGFDAFLLKEGKDAARALQSFETFKLPYQGAVDDPRPLFLRRAV